MRITRIFHPLAPDAQAEITLSKQASHHLLTVLRMSAGDEFELFDGLGNHYPATLLAIDKKEVRVRLGAKVEGRTTSPLTLHLGQVISRGEKMDYTIQKAVELGVSHITPLFSERCSVKLSGDRLEKKMAHWQGVVISACEQCGQDSLPKLHPAVNLPVWLQSIAESSRFILAPGATLRFADLSVEQSMALLVGSEGGLTDAEIKQAEQCQFQAIQLGPRILRTETAALTALSILQFRFGDI